MNAPTRLLLGLCCSLLLLALAPPGRPAQAAPEVAEAAGLVPLPKGCGAGLPPGEQGEACCLFGYVILDGVAVESARVEIINLSDPASETLTLWSAPGPDSEQPYFRAGLSGEPLGVAPGDTIELRVAYGGKRHTLRHEVQAGSQQLDLVLAHAGADDYVYADTITGQSDPGTLALYWPDLAVDGSGVVYITEADNQRVQSFSPTGTPLAVIGEPGYAPDQFNYVSSVAVSSRGELLVTDFGRDAHIFSTLGVWRANRALAGSTTDVAEAPDGGLIAVGLAGSDPAEPQLRRYSAGGELVGEWGLLGAGAGQLDDPWGVVIGPDGAIYVADTGNSRVQVFSLDGEPLRRFGAPGDGPGQLRNPERLAFGPDGLLYVSDTGNHRIQVFGPDGTPVRRWGSLGDGVAELAEPGGLAFGPDGNLYVADAGNQRIQVFSAAGAPVRRFGRAGSADRKLFGPEKVYVSQSGDLFVSDARRNRVKQFAADGRLVRTFGGAGDGPGQLTQPTGVTRDRAGNLYVADASADRIQVFAPDGRFLRALGSFGDGEGELDTPIDLATDAADNLYVLERGNNRLQKLSPSGAHLWTVGGPAAGDEPGQFDRPRGMGIAPDGTIYVADTYNHRVQAISPAGAVLRGWGSLGDGDGELDLPTDVAVVGEEVLVTEYNNTRLNRFSQLGAFLGAWSEAQAVPGNLSCVNGIAAGPDGRLYLASRECQWVTVLRRPSFARPVATIVSAQPAVADAGEPIALRGLASRSQAGAGQLSYEWRLAGRAAPFATGQNPALATDGLAPGTYTVSLVVRDGALASEPATATIAVRGRADAPAEPKRWTFLLYLAGDNPDIDAYLNDRSELGALARLAGRGGPANVTVVALYDGPGQGDTALHIFRPGQALQKTVLGERNMGDPNTLAAFIREGRAAAPSDHVYLAIADHGNGLDGIAWDRTSDRSGAERLTSRELRQALLSATDGGALPIDVLHFDACLMGLIESAHQMRGLARYLIVSQNQAWSAFAYDDYRDRVTPTTAPVDLARAVVAGYTDRVAAGRYPYTIAALDMGQLAPAIAVVDDLSVELIRVAQQGAAQRDALVAVRAQAQRFDSSGNGAIETSDEYVDLGHYAALLAQAASDSALRAAAAQVGAALQSLVLVERSGSGSYGANQMSLEQASGVAIYYPPRPSQRTFTSYRSDFDFATDTRWPEFLQAQLVPLGPALDPVAPPNPVAPLPLPVRLYLPQLQR